MPPPDPGPAPPASSPAGRGLFLCLKRRLAGCALPAVFRCLAGCALPAWRIARSRPLGALPWWTLRARLALFLPWPRRRFATAAAARAWLRRRGFRPEGRWSIAGCLEQHGHLRGDVTAYLAGPSRGPVDLALEETEEPPFREFMGRPVQLPRAPADDRMRAGGQAMSQIRSILAVLQGLWVALVAFGVHATLTAMPYELARLPAPLLTVVAAAAVIWALPAAALGVLMLCTWSAEKP